MISHCKDQATGLRREVAERDRVARLLLDCDEQISIIRKIGEADKSDVEKTVTRMLIEQWEQVKRRINFIWER